MIVAIVQARMGSSRLPGKTLTQIAGKPMLAHVLDRVKASRFVEKALVATTLDASDDQIVAFAEGYGAEVFRGSEQDVLDRFYQAAKEVGAQSIVRVTSDCPLVPPGIIDEVVSEHFDGAYDYTTNTLIYTYPDGCDVEVFSFQALETAWKECSDAVGREHVTPFVRSDARFRIKNVESQTRDFAGEKWSVDRPEDLEFVQQIFESLADHGTVFSFEQITDLLISRPDIRSINAESVVNEGYYKSLMNEPEVPAKLMPIEKSLALLEKAKAIIPSCTQTYSKGPSQFVQGVAPVYLERGEGVRVHDVDGNEYIDLAMALGAIILGHNYPAVSEAVIRQVEKGTIFSLPHPSELEVADAVLQVLSGAEMVRFAKNGSDVTTAAVRLARAFTGRDVIACCGYHGWHDWYIGTTTRNAGVPKAVAELTTVFQYNDIGSLEQVFADNRGRVAAIIMEPVGVVEPEADFLAGVRKIADREGALLVFDEVVSGFRMARGGAQEYFNVIPDLTCLGKAMANGYPLAALAGREAVMRLLDDVFFSLTFGGETLSLVAATATISEMQDKPVIESIWEQGRRLIDGYNVLATQMGLTEVTQCIGLPPRSIITFRDGDGESLVLKSLFQQECLSRGVLFTGSHNICFSHSVAEIDYTLRTYRSALGVMDEAIERGDVEERLAGLPIGPVFRNP